MLNSDRSGPDGISVGPDDAGTTGEWLRESAVAVGLVRLCRGDVATLDALARGPVGMIDTVRKAFADELHVPVDSIGEDQYIEDLPDLDSARLLRVISAIEDELGVSVDDDLLYSASTVGEFAKLFAEDA
jgi:acyl carrier protein